MEMRFGAAVLLSLSLAPVAAAEEAGQLTYDFISSGTFQFGGVTAARSDANVEGWLLPAPRANPGMLGMFRQRDRQPRPDLVPWAGEFVGKYLVSTIQALRMSDDPRLEASAADTVGALVALQAEDGYLGPWPREERLLGQWDLWGHYHIMLALLMWHERTGDPEALAASRRMADLVCRTYLDTERRVLDAGAHEMNMAIIHSLGWLYRLTHEPRYLDMMRGIEEDFESAGDYFRAGLEGVEFYLSPRPRWESLHGVQGLVELYRITGDARYRASFANTWRSIAHRDIHPSGAFSTAEQAIGNPYSQGAIETCSTIAWMALCQDMLRLTGDPEAAEYLDLAYWNAILGAQHPTGRWWAYDTPTDGARLASAHHIVFQARPGTPELNCCSVNGPRGLGMLTEWAVMASPEGLAVNTYAPLQAQLPLPDGRTVALSIESTYPIGDQIRIALDSRGVPLTLSLRIPGWAESPRVSLNGSDVGDAVPPGEYYRLTRVWSPEDTMDLTLGMGWRIWPGDLGRSGQVAIYRGPLLMAFDTHYSEVDLPALEAVDWATLAPERMDLAPTSLGPLVAYSVATTGGGRITLVDFASAGAYGTSYAAWLPASGLPPAPFHLVRPLPESTIPAAPVRMEWVGSSRQGGASSYGVEVARDRDFKDIVTAVGGLHRPHTVLHDLPSDAGRYYWRVTAQNEVSARVNEGGPWSFTVDPSLPADPAAVEQEPVTGPNGEVLRAALAGSPDPAYGGLVSARDVEPCVGPDGTIGGALRFDGQASMVTYALPSWPDDHSLTVWVRPGDSSEDRLHQVFSAWCRHMDDPLRVFLRQGKLFAGWEAVGQAAATPGVEVPAGEWTHVAAVKTGPQLILYVNGSEAARVRAPVRAHSVARACALGGNPLLAAANEHYRGDIASFVLYARALDSAEVTEAAMR